MVVDWRGRRGRAARGLVVPTGADNNGDDSADHGASIIESAANHSTENVSA